MDIRRVGVRVLHLLMDMEMGMLLLECRAMFVKVVAVVMPVPVLVLHVLMGMQVHMDF